MIDGDLPCSLSTLSASPIVRAITGRMTDALSFTSVRSRASVRLRRRSGARQEPERDEDGNAFHMPSKMLLSEIAREPVSQSLRNVIRVLAVSVFHAWPPNGNSCAASRTACFLAASRRLTSAAAT